MNFSVWAWVAFAVLVMAPFATGGLGWYFGLVEGEHRGRCAEKERQLERERRRALRDAGPPPEIRAKTGPLAGFPIHAAPWGAIKTPDHVTAADIRRVVLPLPGTPGRPQPVTNPEPHTRGLPALTDTGEIRAAGDAWVAEMRARGMIT